MNIFQKTTLRAVAICLAAITVISIVAYCFIFRKEKPSSSLSEPYINFGYELEQGDEVIIEKVTPASVDNDVEIFAYDFKLSSGQPDGAIEIIIPYSDKGLKKEDEILSVCGKYLNEETNQWEDVFYRVDAETNKVHIITDHLSTYSVFKITNPGKRSEYISDVNVYAAFMTSTRAQAVLEAVAAQGDSWQLNAVNAFLETTGTVEYFAETNVHTLITLGEAYDDLISKPFQKAMTGLSISTACAQLAYDAYNNGIHSSETTASALKSSLDIAINFATPSIKLAYLSVGITDIALTDVRTFAVANKYKSTKNMYDAYYKRKENSRTLNDWWTLFESYYKKNPDNPQLVLDMMKEEIDRYVNEYWTVAGTDWESWIDAYDKNGKLSKYPWPSEKDRKNISAIYKKQINDYLQSVFRKMSRNMYLDSLIEREKEYRKLANYYNQKFSVVIREDLESDQSSTWAGCYARLAPLSSTAEPTSWTGKLNSDGGATITFTLLGHLKAGFPMTLELYQKASDVKSGKKLKTIQLKPFSEREQTIVLQPRRKDEPTESEPSESIPTDSNPTASSNSSETKPPIQEPNPWYDVTIVSLDNTNPKAFAGWYAVLEYPKDMHVELEDMLAMFDNTGKCILRFQKSDYEALESPSKIWLYQYKEDLLSKKKPDVIVSFSLSGSYSGEYSGEPLYTILVKAKPKGNKDDILNSISGDYSSYMIRAELFIPGEGMMQIDKKEDYEPWEKPSAEVWLHYNGPSLTLKSYSDPYLTEHVLEKFSDTRYEITYQNGTTTVTHTVEIISVGHRAKYTFLSETEGGQRNLSVYILEKK